MSLNNKKYIEVEQKVKNNYAFILEEMLSAVIPSFELLKFNLSEETIEKYKSFYNALCDEVGYLKCDEVDNYYIVEYGKNYIE